MAIYCDRKDVVACAPTGSGKTLSFWIPLIMAQADGLKKIMIVVTPLNLLGQQNVNELALAHIRAVAVNSENNSASLWKVRDLLLTIFFTKMCHDGQDIKTHHFDVVIINPEILMGSDEATVLLEDPKFASLILHIVFDEGHCISEWGRFRKDYSRLGALRHTIRSVEKIPFYVASATLPKSILADIASILRLRDDETRYILQSNDRPEVALLVRPLVYAANSYRDLEFLLPGKPYCNDAPEKFIVFFDNMKEAEAARDALRKRLSTINKSRVKHFHSTMTQDYRREELERFRRLASRSTLIELGEARRHMLTTRDLSQQGHKLSAVVCRGIAVTSDSGSRQRAWEEIRRSRRHILPAALSRVSSSLDDVLVYIAP
ncbi:hypothetical protein PC9H_006803 [Pleurotus ostreatus]|uniref:DNA 3'-5' helicase n=1 Tax=Pleurotus ostreatus TaxID=5322 RepID=A0A8H7DRU5_PLEOS|nr:uncharacterized protein PC9H_006803 [Pleurotus ostreatus]KAF7431085.1 hypothetical protein PC9H_006803 [Pleurotus ostreatus]